MNAANPPAANPPVANPPGAGAGQGQGAGVGAGQGAGAGAGGAGAVGVPAGVPPNLDPNRHGNILEAGYNAFDATREAIEVLGRALGQIQNQAFDADALGVATQHLDLVQQRLAQSQHIADVSRQRASGYEVIPIVTQLPDFAAQIAQGVVLEDQAPNLRELPKITLSGAEGRADDVKMIMQCRAFLDRIMQIARARNLSAIGTRQLLYDMSSGEVQLITGEMLREDRPLEDIVRKIEVTYGGLKSPEDARRSLESIRRNHGETIMELGRRISQEARMATRMDPHRDSSYRSMAVEALLRKVPEIEPYIRRLDDEQIKGGRNRLSYDDILLEATREEGRQRSHRRQMHKYKSTIRQVQEESDLESRSDEEGLMESETEYDFREVQRVLEDYADQRQEMRARYPPKPGFLKGIPRRWEEEKKPVQRKQQPKRRFPPKPQPTQVIRSMGEAYDENEASDDDYISDGEVNDMAIEGISYTQGIYLIPNVAEPNKPFVRVTPGQLNIQDPKQCMKCGLKGHRAFGSQASQCPLKGEPLMPNPCYRCKMGGHSANKCPQGKRSVKN